LVIILGIFLEATMNAKDSTKASKIDPLKSYQLLGQRKYRVCVSSSLKRFRKCLSLILISFMLERVLSIILKSFVDLVGEGYSLGETLLVGPWFHGLS
jgi:hypothetical protein